MLSFLRNDLNQLQAYAPHPGGNSGSPIETQILDRLDTNECPYDLPEELKQKLAWTYQHEIETNRYPDGSHFPLKIAIANYINEIISNSEAFVNPEQISVGNGSDELIRSILIATCLGGEGSILVANPTFSMYGIIAQTLGISVVGIGRDKDTFEMDLNAAKTAIETTQNPPIRVVFVVHPNSPTANALTDNELDWLRQLPEQILVVIDEAYFEFSQTSVIEELKQHPNWVILRTFSKAFRLASLRAGYAIAHPELITALEKVRLPYNLPSFTQTAALLALNNCQDLLKVIPEILAERTNLINALTENKQLKIWRSDANFIYIRLTDEQNSDQALNQIMQQLKTKGTLVRHTGGGLRITVGRPEENQRTIERLFSIL
ncbi:histidinol-phosphate transaminase [Planktothrix agardhii]|jgi:histidinol-phosphate aminotransferase|uniref:histidinol-phosphate transaminase n=1 Tax=Planktothrix agardhii TaxID=1160 RepID=UPI001D0A018A|nr:histidinol-phosphate transaminase [Planktothrix agardhii]MCF3605717.1 histidinol-phosphate transaminase [Planktothrix agardhii 1033]MCB8758488.1 histidinol-phosphate transaminase [Planktothrix agardhii 1813]MCB8787817.1 histidinol-phosphate transaminase [Planktothrix agardhii 1025]MCF3610415.1 histidinol-phosphate transaminase [Planktothrix agardhii 1027]MCF3644013.1 histidinol-phosphate transaminase [Planktothrix agardhii 1026]